jgi:hypothetical protein
VATATLGCAFNHIPDMRAQLDKLPIPPSYQLLGERSDEMRPKIIGLRDIAVSRTYRPPLDSFEETCDDVATAFKSPLELRIVVPSRDSVPFCRTKTQHVRSGWRAGFVSSYEVKVYVEAIPNLPKTAGLPARPCRTCPRRTLSDLVEARETSYPNPPDSFIEVFVSIVYYRWPAAYAHP